MNGSGGRKHRFCTPVGCTKSFLCEIPTPFYNRFMLTKRRKDVLFRLPLYQIPLYMSNIFWFSLIFFESLLHSCKCIELWFILNFTLCSFIQNVILLCEFMLVIYWYIKFQMWWISFPTKLFGLKILHSAGFFCTQSFWANLHRIFYLHKCRHSL